MTCPRFPLRVRDRDRLQRLGQVMMATRRPQQQARYGGGRARRPSGARRARVSLVEGGCLLEPLPRPRAAERTILLYVRGFVDSRRPVLTLDLT